MKMSTTMISISILLSLSFSLQAKVDAPTDPLQNDLKAKYKDFVTHLEFLGYTTTTRKKALHFQHSKNINFLLRQYRGGYLLTATFEGSPHGKKNLPSFLAICNLGNNSATVAKFYLDKDQDFIVEAWYSGPYDKKHFGVFLANWNTDWQTLLRQANTKLVKIFEMIYQYSRP